MTIQLYDTYTLNGVVESIKPLNTFWRDLCFRAQQNFETPYIDFDMVSKGRRLAPFVAPTVQGKVMKSMGFTTKRFTPAYIKEKRTYDPQATLKRRPGEKYTGEMSPGARRDALVAQLLADQREAIERREEWMCANAVLNSSLVINSPEYGNVTVDFGRAANQTIVLAGGATWAVANDATVNVVDDLETWAALILESSGYAASDVVMGLEAWKLFRKKQAVKDSLDTNYRGSDAAVSIFTPTDGAAVQYRGMIGPFRIWTYNDVCEDDTATLQPLMDQKSVCVLNPAGLEGVRAYGAIMDAEAGFQSLSLFPSTWREKDPSAEFFMIQSAPLMIPVRPNAAAVIKVIP